MVVLGGGERGERTADDVRAGSGHFQELIRSVSSFFSELRDFLGGDLCSVLFDSDAQFLRKEG